jgi:RNA polymerase sigma-54 factor
MNTSQNQILNQGQKVNIKQIQFLNFLYLNQQELDQYVNQEMLENPFLELNTVSDSEGDDFESDFADDILGDMRAEEVYGQDELESDQSHYKEYVAQSSSDSTMYDLQMERIQEQLDIRDTVFDQLKYIVEDQETLDIVHFLVYSTNDAGFLDRDLMTITDEICFAKGKFYGEEEIQKAKTLINQCSPIGFGAFDMQDYLSILIATDAKISADFREKSLQVIQLNFDKFLIKDKSFFKENLNIDEKELEDVFAYFLNKNMYPTVGFENGIVENTEYIIPEYQISIVNNELKGELINQKPYPLNVNTNYANSLKTDSRNGTNSYIAEKLKSANWIIDAIQQREDTMTKVINAIVYLQADYFLSGNSNTLKPMILKDIATYIDMNVSTVSRVTSNKYAITPLGLINLKELFTEAIYLSNGERKSNKEIQDLVIEIVKNEDKHNPLSDLDIQKILRKERIELTRRTITKYRNLGQIPASKLRKIS